MTASDPPTQPRPPVDLLVDRRLRRWNKGDEHKLTAVGGLAALSLDALSSVAYGPEAVVLALVAAGSTAVKYTVPVSIAIAVLLLVLVVSYRQVIAVHPDGGGAYAVAKKELGRPVSLLAAASLVVDYILTVAVSLAAGAASLGSVFPFIAQHLLITTLVGLLLLTLINLVGIAESAKVLMLPTLVFIMSILAIIVMGLYHSHPVAVIGSDKGFRVTEAVGILLLLKAFAAGCSALTGVEAIANGVPAFRTPAVKRAQRTEVSLGVLLGLMLIGLAILIHRDHIVPRGNVTVLAQLSAAAFGTGWPFYVSNLAVTLVLALAANTSFGGLPVLFNLLGHDHRMPHLFTLRRERPVFRVGVGVLALLAALVLCIVNADTNRLLPVFAIGVFIGFTISQVGLVLHWIRQASEPQRGSTSEGRAAQRVKATIDPAQNRVAKAILNGFGAALSAIAAVVFFASKFLEGAWLLLIIVPGLILLFDRIEKYYLRVGAQLSLGEIPAKPNPHADTETVVIVPVVAISKVTKLALEAAMKLGNRVVPVAVEIDPASTYRLARDWEKWDPGPELVVLPSPHRTMHAPLIGFVRKYTTPGRQVVVLLPQVEPKRRRDQLLHNQRAPILGATLRSKTEAIVATFGVHVQ